MASVDPLEEPTLPLERLDPSCFWRGIDASLADKWSTGSRPSLFPPLGDRLNLAGHAMLLLRRKARLGVRCGEGHLVEQLRLHRPKRKEFVQSTGWELSSNPTELTEVHRPKRLLRV